MASDPVTMVAAILQGSGIAYATADYSLQPTGLLVQGADDPADHFTQPATGFVYSFCG